MKKSNEYNLVIVESLAKAKTIEKYLNTSSILKSLTPFKVIASFGHIDNLPPKELGIDILNDFKLHYEIIPDKKKIINDMKEKCKNSRMVWIASDADFEGEKIADSIRNILKLKIYKRITFTEITQKALEHSIQNPREISDLLVNAQETRRILDRLVGYKLSPLLWSSYKTSTNNALSAGRVQSAVMHIIHEREKEIEKHISKCYWYFIGSFSIKESKDNSLKDIKLYKESIVFKTEDKNEVNNIIGDIKNDFSINELNSKVSKQYPESPYVTSSFQQDAHVKLGIGLKRSMQIAQELYENGYITYMRTDSCALSEDFRKEVEQYVYDNYGKEYWEGKAKCKISKNAQQAHEAIRPTHINMINLPEDSSFGSEHKKIYSMIWKRSIASLLKPTIYNELIIHIVDSSMLRKKLYFIGTMKRIKWNGYQIVYGVKNDVDDIDILKSTIQNIICKEVVAKNTWSNPPNRFNDSSLVKIMESEGIGRPSTYSSSIQKLFDRIYITKSNISGEKKDICNIIYNPKKGIYEQLSSITIGDEQSRIVPTSIGKEVDEFVTKWFPYIVDKKFTSHMEEDLDKIADGNKNKLDVLNTFWSVFEKDLNIVKSKVTKNKTTLQTNSLSFNIDNQEYIVRLAKFGPVIEFKDNGQKHYIGLQQYLKFLNKKYTDINENDIAFMLKMPIILRGKYNEKVKCMFGPYGMYIKSEQNTNHKIPAYAVHKIIDSQGYLEPDIVTSILEYDVSTYKKNMNNNDIPNKSFKKYNKKTY